MAEPILVARRADVECFLLPEMANRHGLITGATGTGKTVTLQTLAENFSRRGVPVFIADVKGDLAGITQPGTVSAKLAGVLKERGIEAPAPAACPATLWDVYADAAPGAAQGPGGAKPAMGHPVRATVSDMGPLLLGRMLDLNEIQQGVLQLVFKIADDNGLLLLDLKDLRAMLQHVGDNAAQFTTEYGNVSAASIGAIQRGLMQIGAQGGDRFFGEPMLDLADFLQTAPAAASAPGRAQGVVNILAADRLMTSPRLYATFLLWMLSELFERLPEVGDPRAAQARLLLRRGAPAVRRGAEGAARAHRAGRAPDPQQGRRRLVRDPEPARRARCDPRPARQPRPARAARLHAARPEGGQGGGEHDAPQPRPRRRHARSPSSPSARRWSACSTRRAGRRSPSASTSFRREAGSARSATPSAPP